MLNRAIKIKSKEADYTINYWVDYTNERGKPNRGCHKLALKCSIHFIFPARMEGEIPLPRNVSAHIICRRLLEYIWAKAVKTQIV